MSGCERLLGAVSSFCSVEECLALHAAAFLTCALCMCLFLLRFAGNAHAHEHGLELPRLRAELACGAGLGMVHNMPSFLPVCSLHTRYMSHGVRRRLRVQPESHWSRRRRALRTACCPLPHSAANPIARFRHIVNSVSSGSCSSVSADMAPLKVGVLSTANIARKICRALTFTDCAEGEWPPAGAPWLKLAPR